MSAAVIILLDPPPLSVFARVVLKILYPVGKREMINFGPNGWLLKVSYSVGKREIINSGPCVPILYAQSRDKTIMKAEARLLL